MQSYIENLSEREILDLAKDAASGRDAKMKQSQFYASVHEYAAAKGPTARATLLRDTLSHLLNEQEPKIDQLNYPAGVRDLVRAEFQRIDQALIHSEDSYFDLMNHAARCDFRIICFSRVPMGVDHIETEGLPRSLLYRGGVSQAIRFVRMLTQTGGVKPFFNPHISHGIRPAHFLLAVNHKALVRQYCNIAECLKMNPQYRGVFGGSWWFDPQLATISPPPCFPANIYDRKGGFSLSLRKTHAGTCSCQLSAKTETARRR